MIVDIVVVAVVVVVRRIRLSLIGHVWRWVIVVVFWSLCDLV